MSLPTQRILVPVRGGDLAVFQYGNGSGEPVLLVHGVTSSNRAFQLFADALIARGKAPFAVDLRGRGDSNSLPAPFGMKQHAEDMATVIDHFGWNKPDVIGHSMGAATVMMAAGARNKLNMSEVPKFKAYIAISPQGAGLIFPEMAWSDINPPVLMLTGTQDKELGGLSWETRTEPFNNMKSGCKWLGVIGGATHMNFAGRGISKKTETLTSQVIRDFLTGVQAGDCKLLNQISGMTISVK